MKVTWSYNRSKYVDHINSNTNLLQPKTNLNEIFHQIQYNLH